MHYCSIIQPLQSSASSNWSVLYCLPDYQERIARHEAAHYLVAYLIGLPILGYSLDIGKEHVNLIDEQLQKLIYSGQLDGKELDRSSGWPDPTASSSCHAIQIQGGSRSVLKCFVRSISPIFCFERCVQIQD
ncbi:hypothetical protein SETIT_2G021300v2 [Setaria italica]|uniref:Peptidase M41 domain-containing protein n=1 Tax=Setaria italica TaxID=4555 RepID=A0A368PUP6_SETIT|nr:hypothetical protein SETIT_2G021300v2 [Setaria italica]RCV09359.1 hypothetical protein SETIT_2G021300v2 [Setaria italica]